jgi:hypothetical protein
LSLPGSTYTIIDNDGTDAIRGAFSGLAEGATFTSGLATFRISYRAGTGNDVVLTHLENTAPKFPNRSITSPIVEGGVAIVVGDISEPDTADLFILEVNWGDGTPRETYTFAPGTPRASVSHIYGDNAPADPGQFVVDMLWRDQHGAFNVGSLPVTVTNVAPRLPEIADVRMFEPGLLLQPGTFIDPGADSWTATVDYGDGAGLEALPLQGKNFTLARQYTEPGFYQVSVNVEDDDGAVGSTSFLVRVWPEGERQPGDGNEDGQFDSADLILAFAAGKYETDEPAVWSEGDWNNDGRFDSTDLVLALSTGNYEHGRYDLLGGPRAAIAIFDESPGDDMDSPESPIDSSDSKAKPRSRLAVDDFFEKLAEDASVD